MHTQTHNNNKNVCCHDNIKYNKIPENVTIKIGHDHNIKLRRIFDNLWVGERNHKPGITSFWYSLQKEGWGEGGRMRGEGDEGGGG